MEPDRLFVGVDLGTSGCRAVAIDSGGVVTASARASLPAPQTEGERRTQSAALWWEAVTTCLEQLLAQVPGERVVALAIDGTSGTLLLTDRQGEPLGPARLYNDHHAQREAACIQQVAPAESGAHGATSALAKLLNWLGDGRCHGRYALHQADWIAARLSGRWGISDENNALKLGYDPISRDWPSWLESLGVPATVLPEVVPPGSVLGPIQPAVARSLGLNPQAQIIAGTTDSVAAFLATGAQQAGEAVTSLGSTLALKIIAERPIFSPAYGVYSHRLGNMWLAGGASNSGGAVLHQYFTQAQLDALTPQLRPDQPIGLDYYPLPGPGERFPIQDPSLAPQLSPRPEDDAQFFQAILEGIAAIEAQGYRRLAKLGAPYPTRILSVGGGANNAAWRLIREQALGVAVEVAAHHEAAYGTALLARQGWQSIECP